MNKSALFIFCAVMTAGLLLAIAPTDASGAAGAKSDTAVGPGSRANPGDDEGDPSSSAVRTKGDIDMSAPASTNGDTSVAATPEITKMPSLKTFHEAVYPPKALQERIEAEVTLQVDIDAEGRVEAVSVLIPATPADYAFDAAALAAVRLFVFAPAEAGDTRIPVRINYKYRFTLAQIEIQPAAPSPSKNFGGRALERGTRLPLAGIIITVFRGDDESAQGFESITTASGEFAFFDLPAGRWKVIAEPEGYFPLRTTEQVVVNEETNATYYVEKRSYNRFDLLVEGERQRKHVTHTPVSIEEIEKTAGSMGDMLSVIPNLPGVARAAPFSGEIITRGSSPEDTSLSVDGARVFSLYHFFGLRSVIPSGMVDSIDFIPGNFSTEYGRAIGGILDVKLKKLRPEKFGGYLDVSLLDVNLFLEMPIGDNAAIAISGRRSHLDAVLKASIPADATVSLTAAPRYYDAEVLFSYRPAPGHELRAFVLFSDDRIEVLFKNPADFGTSVSGNGFRNATNFYRTHLEYNYVPNESLSNSLRLSAGRNQVVLEGLGIQVFSVDWYETQLRDTLRWGFSDWGTLVTGVDYFGSINSLSGYGAPPPKEGKPFDENGPPAEDIRTGKVDKQVDHSLGLFAELELNPVDGLLITPGLRFDYSGLTNAASVAPRIIARYDLSNDVTIKGGAGLFYQDPTLDETLGGFGNPDLGIERAIHYSAGVEYRLTDYLSVDFTGFYKDLGSLVTPSDKIIERNGKTIPEFYNNDGTGRVYGGELFIRHRSANGFFGWLSYSFGRSERRDTVGAAWRLFDSDQTHILTALGSYQLPRGWEIGFRWRLVSGNPATPVVGSIFDADADAFEPVFGKTNTIRAPAFHQLDVRIDKKWVFDGWMLNAYLDIQNAYDQENAGNPSYNYDYSEADWNSGLPILPVLGLRGEF